jgi:hypothetical protein
MLPNVEYNIRVYYTNGTLAEERDIELEENNQLVSFGFYSKETSYKNILNFASNAVILIVISMAAILILVALVFYFNRKLEEASKNQKSSSRYKIPHRRSLVPDS